VKKAAVTKVGKVGKRVASACALLWILWQALASMAIAQSLDYSAASPNGAQIDEYLTRKKSPMIGIGADAAKFGHDNNVDPRLPIAISGGETTFGMHLCAANNAWNWFHHVTCPASPFMSFPSGVGTVTHFLRLAYINKGYDSIPLIRQKYCAEGCDNWVRLITLFYNEMPTSGAAVSTIPVAPTPTTPVVPAVKTPTTPPVPPARLPSTPGSAPVSTTPAGKPSATSAKVTPPAPVPPKPDSTAPATPASSPSASDGDHILGMPSYVIYVLAALALGAWATSGVRRGRQ
jgi:hypothetical protein